MPFWRRREETLNESLAREAGLSLAGETPERHPEPEERRDDDRAEFLFRRAHGVLTDIDAVHGPHRAREWDTVATVRVAGIQGERVNFVALPEGDLVVDEDVPDEALEAVAAAVEATVEPPYRAEAVRRGDETWAVAARTIDVVELPADVEGDELELAVHEGERTLTLDGLPTDLWLPALDRLLEDRHASYVVRATRLEDRLWEAEIFPL